MWQQPLCYWGDRQSTVKGLNEDLYFLASASHRSSTSTITAACFFHKDNRKECPGILQLSDYDFSRKTGLKNAITPHLFQHSCQLCKWIWCISQYTTQLTEKKETLQQIINRVQRWQQLKALRLGQWSYNWAFVPVAVAEHTVGTLCQNRKQPRFQIYLTETASVWEVLFRIQ